MKVYVLLQMEYEYTSVFGIYATREAAENTKAVIEATPSGTDDYSYSIGETELEDGVPSPPETITCWVNLDENGEIWCISPIPEGPLPATDETELIITVPFTFSKARNEEAIRAKVKELRK